MSVLQPVANQSEPGHSPSKYEAAALGFPNYWYPVARSWEVTKKPLARMLLGKELMFVRSKGKVYALLDYCPHRGVPLSLGRSEFPGTFSCRYHGWTFDVATGELVAALTDGPNSAICGKVSIRTYPVEERAGLVWVYMGSGKPPPVEEDIPEAFLHPDAVIVSRITERRGNWRFGAENGFDEAHAKYLHRYGCIWTFFRQLPAWTIARIEQDGPWITRQKMPGNTAMVADYPGLGAWPKVNFWNKVIKGRGGGLSLRLPGLLRSQYERDAHYEWYVPVDRDHYRYLQFIVTRGGPLRYFFYKLQYWSYRRWLFHVQFNNQDSWMVRTMKEEAYPVKLFRPDSSIFAWRRMCEHPRGESDEGPSLGQQLDEIHKGLELVSSRGR